MGSADWLVQDVQEPEGLVIIIFSFLIHSTRKEEEEEEEEKKKRRKRKVLPLLPGFSSFSLPSMRSPLAVCAWDE